jgi:hypothetical protein
MDDARLKQRVGKIAESVKNIRFEELCSLLDNHIRPFCEARGLKYDHRNPNGSHHVFLVGDSKPFTIVKTHGTSQSQLKRQYVESFLEAMEHINLYE